MMIDGCDDQEQIPPLLDVPCGQDLTQASAVLREVGQERKQICPLQQVLAGQLLEHCDPSWQVPTGHDETHEPPYWTWLDEHEVVATQAPLVAWNPDWQLMQKPALKQEAQLAEQVRHFWLRLSGKKPVPQLLTQEPLRRNCPAGQATDGAELLGVELLTHPPKPLSAYPVKQPPKMQMPSQNKKPLLQMFSHLPLENSWPQGHWVAETHRWLASILNPERHLVHRLTVPEHSAQLELQGRHEPEMAVDPAGQLAMQAPLETMPELQVQMPLTGRAPEGQVVWHCPWKKQNPLRQVVQAPVPSQVAQGQGQLEQTPPLGTMAALTQLVQQLWEEQEAQLDGQFTQTFWLVSKNWAFWHPFWQMDPDLTYPAAQDLQLEGKTEHPQHETSQATHTPWKLNWFSPHWVAQVPLVETEPWRQEVQLSGPVEQVVHWMEQGAHSVLETLQNPSGQLSTHWALPVPVLAKRTAGQVAQQPP